MLHHRLLAIVLLLGSLPLATSVHAAETSDAWSRFRGPNGTGVADAGKLPVELGPDTNVEWKVAVPAGHSSPVLAADRIFLTGVEGDELLVLALDRATGRELWRRTAPRPRKETLDNRNDPAAPSPVTDGQRVFAFFGDFGLIAYTADGEELWRRPLGPFNNFYGVGASPILVEGLLVLSVDQHDGSFLLALDPADGSTVWRTERPEAKTGHSTPVVHRPDDGPAQIILPGSFFLTAYDPKHGEKLWWVSGLSFEMKSTPAIENGVLFINGYGSPMNEEGQQVKLLTFEQAIEKHDADGDGAIGPEEAPSDLAREWLPFVDLDRDGALDEREWGYFQDALDSRNGLLAIKLPSAKERGDLTSTHVLWTYHRKIPQLPSPVAYRGVLLMVDDRGITTTLRAEQGDVIAQDRLEGAVDSFYASPVAGDGHFYLISRSGTVVVLPVDGSLEPIAVSDLDDIVNATPAIADGRIYLRTREHLYSFKAAGDAASDAD